MATRVTDPTQRLATQLGQVAALLKGGSFREARTLAQSAATLPLTHPAELIELARRLMYFNLSSAMRDVAVALLARPVWHAAAEADFAAMLSMAGEQILSSRLLDRAIAVIGVDAGRLYNRSQMHLYAGRMDEAASDLRRTVSLDLGMARAHWALSKLPSPLDSAGDIGALRRALARVVPDSQDEAFLRFGLFNHLDRAGDNALAWAELERGCSVKRRLLTYDESVSHELFDALRKAFPDTASVTHDGAVKDDMQPTPIFIVGMHRSGTTLLERILGSHSQVSEGGELYDFPAQLRLATGRHFNGPLDIAAVRAAATMEYDAIGRGYLEQIAWRAAGKPFLVDKLPSNFLNIGFMRKALPRARIIHMRRDAMDTCYSNLKELFSNACAYSYDQQELAGYFAMHRELMEHWHTVAPGAVLDVSYESLARNPEHEARRILEFCGLPWEAACLEVGSTRGTVNTASSAQVREPIHARNIAAWQRHASSLAPLAARLSGLGAL